MELIVKIGGDQQGLQDVIARMKRDFANTNVSMPLTWQAQQQARQQYGGIMSAAPAPAGLADTLKGIPIVGELAGKLSGLLGPVALVSSALGGLAAGVHGITQAISHSAADLRTGRVTGMSGLMARRVRQAAGAAGIEADSAAGMINKLNIAVGGFNAGEQGPQELFGELGINPSGLAVDDLIVAIKKKFAGLKDPALRARLAKGLFGRGAFDVSELLAKLEAPGAADTEGLDMAAAAGIKKWWKALNRKVGETAEMVFTKAAGVVANSRVAHWLGIHPGAELNAMVAGEEEAGPAGKDKAAAALAARTAANHVRFSRESDAAMAEGKRKQSKGEADAERESIQAAKEMRFEPDQLAKAGLFAGSSLLLNPNFSVQQQQLDVLRQIESNQHRGDAFSP